MTDASFFYGIRPSGVHDMLYDGTTLMRGERESESEERERERERERDAALVFRVVDQAEKTVSKLL